jgi:hypothetical protein
MLFQNLFGSSSLKKNPDSRIKPGIWKAYPIIVKK